MNDVPTYSKIIDAALAFLAAAVIWFTKRSVQQYDDRIETLERDSVRVASLQQLRDQLTDEHRDNLLAAQRRDERLGRMEDALTSTHKRVDDLFKFLAGRQ
jgi:hypothetical protein